MKRSFRKSNQCLLFVCFLLFIIFLYQNHQSLFSKEIKKTRKSQSDPFVLIDQTKWREYLLSGVKSTKLCRIPSIYSRISDGLCKMYSRKQCDQFDCEMIYSSKVNRRSVKCLSDGQIFRENSLEDSIQCEFGSSLDLFAESSSMIVDSYVEFSEEFYLRTIPRDSQSILTTNFNFESISNYPWNRNVRRNLNFSFGYDRSLFDFIPKPWLYDYLHLIKQNQFNLTVKQIIANKKRIHSQSNIDYFLNHQVRCCCSSSSSCFFRN